MGFASQSIESIAQSPIDTLNMDRPRLRNHLTQSRADLDGKEFAMVVAMFDRLCQAHLWGNHECWVSTSSCSYRLTIRSGEDRRIASPAITTPCQGTALGASHNKGYRSLDEIVADASGGTGGDETAGAILDETSPTFSGVGLVRETVFFRTKDQNSSISTVERCRSCVRTAVKASACSLARRNHSPIVSYL